MSWTLSPCVEWLFAEGGRSIADRIRAAARAGFIQVELWTTQDKYVDELEAAIKDSGVTLTAFVSEPAGRLVDPATHREFLAGVEQSCEVAHRLGARNLIVVSGDTRAGVDRMEQRDALTQVLRCAAPIASAAGVGLLLEPLNTRIDHKGYFLDSTPEALDVIRDVGHPALRLLYDMYHSIVMGEEPGDVLAGSGSLIGHVHIADVPGRHEPGTGAVEWRRHLGALKSAGYARSIGLEYVPLRDTESSLEFIRGVAADLR